MRRIQSACAAICVAALLALSGCGGNEPKLVSNQTAVANARGYGGNSQGANANTPARGTSSSSSSAPEKSAGGDYIDTSQHDAKINRLEEQSKKKPGDEALRKQLAQGYLERGNALTGARQYQAALGDYRRTLRYDPANEEAKYWADTIIGILKQMNRPVPEEGSEPPPLQKQ